MCDPTFKRQKTPLEGFGVKPGEIYYTSRTNRATAHYNQYIAKLRASEEEERRGDDLNKTEERDQQQSNFFIRCDRKSLIKKVAQRVDLAMASYQDDLDKKRARLSDLLTKEEEDNIRKFVVQVQSGAELAWKEKEDRLAYLLAKRQKEHEEKYKDTPLTKCMHLTPLLVKQRAKENQEIQLYQMREKEARREAEREFDMMWHELTMKESEALGISEPDTPEVGTVTIYNKVTGEPFSWAGVVPMLTRPSGMDYVCLRVKLSDLDLLPNSANVDLIGSQQVSDSNRAVCGHPVLDDIHITVFVKI